MESIKTFYNTEDTLRHLLVQMNYNQIQDAIKRSYAASGLAKDANFWKDVVEIVIAKMEAGLLVIPPPQQPSHRYNNIYEWEAMKHKPPADPIDRLYFDLLVHSVESNKIGYIRGILELNLERMKPYLLSITLHAYAKGINGMWRVVSRFLTNEELKQSLGRLHTMRLDEILYLDWIVSPLTNDLIFYHLIKTQRLDLIDRYMNIDEVSDEVLFELLTDRNQNTKIISYLLSLRNYDEEIIESVIESWKANEKYIST